MSILEKIHVGPAYAAGPTPVVEVDDLDYEKIVAIHSMVVAGFCRRRLGLCREFARIFSQSAKDHPEVFFVAVNVKKSQKLASRLGARCLPTVMTILNGNAIESHCGHTIAVTLEEMVIRLRRAGSHAGDAERVH